MKGAPDARKQVRAYLSHDGAWIDIHLTTRVHKPQDDWGIARALWRFRMTDGGR